MEHDGRFASNYVLQDQVDILRSQVEASKLESETLELENSYFAAMNIKSFRLDSSWVRLRRASISNLPTNTVSDSVTADATKSQTVFTSSNLQAWMNFF